MKGTSKAYKEGFKSKANQNPYLINTQEFNDFERGWSQRIKRGYSCGFVYQIENIQNSSLEYMYKNEGQPMPRLSKFTSYAEAKGK